MPAPTFEDWFLEMTEILISKCQTVTQAMVKTWENLYTECWAQGLMPEKAAEYIILKTKK